MRLPLAAVVVSAVLVAAGTSRAASSDAFDRLVPELRARVTRLTDDPAAVRRLRAAQASLALIDGASTLSQDCRAAAAVDAILVRAFRDEFTYQPETFAARLGAYVGDVHQRLYDIVQARREDLQARVQDLPDGQALRVLRFLDAADRAIESALRAGGFVRQARLLARAADALARGEAAADADPIQ